ncbi:RlpA-like double-psi beta-barrel-protein domain-containing protein-containing protein [Pilobolus umbonatus]|nr:RlpA-like double-psi beta-barrel-protein domain-containing protein-containing protein [Pilobolus umbonatus]
MPSISQIILLSAACLSVALAVPLEARSFSGDGTYYNTGIGSCGDTNNDNELVVALNAPQMEYSGNPNNNPLCGKRIRVTNKANGKSVTVKIVDMCPPCSYGSVDLSPAAFQQIADLSTGRIKVQWDFT